VNPSAEVQAARARVATQIKNLSQFLYLYGGIAKGIESADRAAREGNASAATLDQNEQTKARVKESIRNVRDGLDKLETDFSSTTALRPYYAGIVGVASKAQMAETQAQANRFDEAGRSLLRVVNQLADALTMMR
jgi:GTP1/Obg family GTP-binding protein